MPYNRSLIEGPYLRDILAQPQALEATRAGLVSSPAPADTVRRLNQGDFHRIVLTGMGNSCFALHSLDLELLNRGHASVLVETSELLYYLPSTLDSRTLLIAVSQSGRSAEMVRLLDIRQPGCFTLAITNTADSPLARRADAVILTHAGEEATVACKTYLATLMAVKWLTDQITGASPDRSRHELSLAAPAVASYLETWRDHVAAAEAELEGVRDLFVVGRGPSLATARTGGLIAKESAHFHSEGMSSAAFRHGPFEMINPTLYALVLAGDPAVQPLHRRLVADIVEAGGRAALASEDAEPGLFRLPAVPPSLRPLVEILPLEMMTLALAAMSGREAGKFERASKVTATE